MPELPEVEMVRRNLTGWLCGRTVISVASSGRHRGIQGDAIGSIVGARIDAIGRIGKYLMCHIGPDRLVAHLGMSGRFASHERTTYVSGPHDHVEIGTDDGAIIVFQDHRRFGRIFLTPADRSALPPLGPDALDDALTPVKLAGLLRKRSGQIKPLLMDQSVIAGLGNIYVCEILWSAEISPFRTAQSLKIDDYRRLADSLSEVLARAITAGGATLDDYRNTNGQWETSI